MGQSQPNYKKAVLVVSLVTVRDRDSLEQVSRFHAAVLSALKFTTERRYAAAAVVYCRDGVYDIQGSLIVEWFILFGRLPAAFTIHLF